MIKPYYGSLSKGILTIFFIFFSVLECIAQRYYLGRSYEIVGLADEYEVLEALQLGIPLIFVGFIIAYFTMWRKRKEENKNKKVGNVGCLGVLLMGIGFFVLIPLWTWVEAAVGYLFSIIFVLAIVSVIVIIIFRILR